MKVDKKLYLKDAIRRKIGNRILLGLLIFIFIMLLQTFIELRKEILVLKVTAQDAASEISDFVVGQLLVNESEAAELKIKNFNEKNKTMQVKWIQTGDPGSINTLNWRFPASWSVIYPLQKFESRNYGYLEIYGTLVSDKVIVESIIEKVFLLLIFIVTMILIFYPLTEKIPTQLIINPINEILSILLYKKRKNINRSTIYEIDEIEEKIIKYIDIIEKKSIAEAVGEVAAQVAHDIRSPIAAIMMLTESCAEIQESKRICLREAAERIQDIANILLAKHSEPGAVTKDFKISPVLVSSTILSVLSAKRAEYQRGTIKFKFEANIETYFTFILANTAEFKRMLSNMLNNAVEAMEGREGEVLITLEREDKQLNLSISDAGRGISDEQVKNILYDTKIQTNKEAGHGLGLAHAREVIKSFNAKLNIYSVLNQGTKIELLFNIVESPMWITDEIILKENDCVVILDDDQSIHGAWNEIFSIILNKHPLIKLVHFTSGAECIDYISKLPPNENLLLLSDYELIAQEVNGLDVIEKINPQRAILVTSHYESNNVVKRSILLNTKILPKMLAYQVKLTVSNKSNIKDISSSKADLVFLEDDKVFSDVFSFLYEREGKKINIYHTPYELLENLSSYPDDTKICTDYDLSCPVTGVDLAEVLYKKGYKNLYLATGFKFNQNELPCYLQLLESKMAIKDL